MDAPVSADQSRLTKSDDRYEQKSRESIEYVLSIRFDDDKEEEGDLWR